MACEPRWRPARKWFCCAAAGCARWLRPNGPRSWGWRPTTSWKVLKATPTPMPSAAKRAAGACAACPGGRADNGCMSFLALDIGNTRLKWAQYASPRPGAALVAQGAEFLENIDKLAEGTWRGLAAPSQVLGCVVAADAVKRRLEEQMEMWDVA